MNMGRHPALTSGYAETQQQRNLSTMVNPMIKRVVHQLSQWHRSLVGRNDCVFDVASQLVVFQL